MDNISKIDSTIYKPWENRLLEIKANTKPCSEQEIVMDVRNAFKRNYKDLIIFSLIFVACSLLGDIIFFVIFFTRDNIGIKEFLLINIYWIPTAIICLITFLVRRKYHNKEKLMGVNGIKTVNVICTYKEIFEWSDDTAYFIHFSDNSICRIDKSLYNSQHTAVGKEFQLIYIHGDENLPVIGYKA